MNGLVLAVGLAAFPGAPSALPHSLLVFSGCFARLQEWVPLLGDKSQTATGVIHQTACKGRQKRRLPEAKEKQTRLALEADLGHEMSLKAGSLGNYFCSSQSLPWGLETRTKVPLLLRSPRACFRPCFWYFVTWPSSERRFIH